MMGDGAVLLVIDAANVIGSVPDGWWRDRAGAARRLRDAMIEVATHGIASDTIAMPLRSGPLEVVLVVEGRARGVESVPGVRVVAAPGSGDDAIVDLVAREGQGRSCFVATADRELIDRVRAVGASVVGPRSVHAKR